jgi:hypothetical protein
MRFYEWSLEKLKELIELGRKIHRLKFKIKEQLGWTPAKLQVP